MTRMLVTVCVIYTVCTLPYATHSFFRLSVRDFRPEGGYENTMFATAALMHLCLSVNSSANFLVYYNMSTRFRDTLKVMVKRKPREAGRPEWNSRETISESVRM